MKLFFKFFIILVIIFTLISGYFLYDYYMDLKEKNLSYIPPYNDDWYDISDITESESYESYNDLINAINKGHRVNFLVMGLEWPRTDTIMLVSFDKVAKHLDIISIPRDSYYYKEGFRSGFKDMAEYKLNAVYGDEGPEGTVTAVEDILGIPIHNYVTITYKGVENVVNAIGGVDVNIPFDMKYEDVWDDPPLVIDLKKGQQTLNGKKSIQFLRFRQNSDGSIRYGDIDRIKVQQQFIKSALKKGLSLKLPLVIKELFYSVKTDADLLNILDYANIAVGINMDDIDMCTAPGDTSFKNGYSFYELDKASLTEKIYDIYGVKIIKKAQN